MGGSMQLFVRTLTGRSVAVSADSFALVGLQEDVTVHLNCDLSGGGKKRKKKVYTQPKKIKHKHKKVKLAVLKYYKVDGSGKVQKLRKECPAEMCGPGVFMAMHYNRYYCGKCALTYVIKKEDE